jgi:hypothetical protein
MQSQARNKRKQGAILGFALILLLVFSVLGIQLVTQSSQDAVEAARTVSSVKAFWAAEAGLQKAKAWARVYTIPFENIPGLTLDWTEPIGPDSYHVQIIPDPANVGRATKEYDIVSTGTSGSTGSRAVKMHCQIESFASYMHASNFETMPNGSPIYFGPGDRLDGMVYVNGTLNIFGGSPNPVFLQLVRSAQGSVNYQGGANSSVFQGGLTLNAPPLDFNLNQDPVASIKAIAQNGGLALTAAGQYSIGFNANGSMTYKERSGSAFPWGPTTTNSISSFNGAIYVNGAVVELSGTLKGNVTIAAQDKILITSNLVYNSAPPNSQLYSPTNNPNTIVDSLGLVANNEVTIMGTLAINIQAAILVTQGDNGFGADQRYNNIGQPSINLFGSISQYRRGVVGTVAGDGYKKNYKYDTRFLANPPPFFPYSLYAFSQWIQTK